MINIIKIFLSTFNTVGGGGGAGQVLYNHNKCQIKNKMK